MNRPGLNEWMRRRIERERWLRGLEREPRYPLPYDWPGPERLNCVSGLVDMLRAVGPFRRVVEIGSYRGISTEALCLFANEVVAVDPNADLIAFDVLRARYPGLSLVRAASPAAAALFAPATFDCAYIDGNHTYEAVRADIQAWLPKMRAGGVMAGHDHIAGLPCVEVIEAVRDELGAPDAVFSDTSWLVQLP